MDDFVGDFGCHRTVTVDVGNVIPFYLSNIVFPLGSRDDVVHSSPYIVDGSLEYCTQYVLRCVFSHFIWSRLPIYREKFSGRELVSKSLLLSQTTDKICSIVI